MSVSVISLALLRRDFAQRALGDDVKFAAFVPDSLLWRWLTDAYRELVKAIPELGAAVAAIDTIAGQLQYDQPADILDRLTFRERHALIKDTTGSTRRVRQIDWDQVRENYGDLANVEGTRGTSHWAFDERENGKLLLLWPPATSISGGFILDYVRDPGTLSRLYDDDDATCAVTSGDATVTFAASISGRVAVGDVFGVKAAADELPADWYRIAELTDPTTIELTEVYGGVTGSAELFTLSQVPSLEYKRPGLAQYGAVEFALWKYWQREESAGAETFRGAWLSQIARIRGEAATGNKTRQGQHAVNYHPALRR
jgi:hypothetical protein